ncbi:MAG TPA: GNAT family N-acetyltransferase [Actinomycetota bacterium]|nr:GNAT family N-acetyltransferase [Actinomycetota bacterium]
MRPAVASDRAELVRLLDEMKAHHREFDPDEGRFNVPEDDLDGFVSEVLADAGVTVLVVEGEDRLLGFVQYRILPKSWGRSCEIDLLAVDEAVRGRGLGTAMMREVERLARGSGAGGVRLNVSLGNDGARRFYERLGYAQSGVRLAKPLPE